MERRNRNLLQWDERHREFSEVWDETLNRRGLKLPKSIEEQMIEAERAELLCKAVDGLPEIQRRRFLLYYEYEFNFYQIAACAFDDWCHLCEVRPSAEEAAENFIVSKTACHPAGYWVRDGNPLTHFLQEDNRMAYRVKAWEEPMSL